MPLGTLKIAHSWISGVGLWAADVGAFFEVYGELGYGFLESVYRSAMGIGLREAGLEVQCEVEVHALFRGHSVGVFRLDFVVEPAVIVELKPATNPASGLHHQPKSSSHQQLILALRSSAFICGPLLSGHR